MQLIAISLALLSLLIFVGTTLFVGEWLRALRQEPTSPLMREGICHIGISAIVLYPESAAPLHALLEEEYPRSEAIIVTDFASSPFEELLHHFKLIKVNHSHLSGVRALYRSRHRAFRRIVVIDLPALHRHQATTIAKEIATYNCTLLLQGESIVAHNILTYCANIIATHPTEQGVAIRALIGAEALLEQGEADSSKALSTARPLAWQRGSVAPAIAALIAPALFVAISRLTSEGAFIAVAGFISLTIMSFTYLSCRLMCKKGLMPLLATIILNFYRFSIEKFKKIYYLYKGDRASTRNAESKASTMFSTATLQEENQPKRV